MFNSKVQRAGVACGPAVMAFFFAGLLLAGWVPPKGPGQSALQTAQMYRDHTTGIRLACVLIMMGGACFAPFFMVMSAQMKRIEGRYSPLAYLQMGMGVVGGTAFFTIPCFFWMAAAYDPGRDPDVTRALHIAGWLPMMCAIWPAVLQNVSIAIATFTDQRRDPVFPRWFGYFNLWVAVLFFPAGLVIFFHHGAFAFNGVLGFWCPALAFTAWTVVTAVMLLRAIGQQEAEVAMDVEVERPLEVARA